MFLLSRGSIYIFFDSLFSFWVYFNLLAFVFSEPFPNVSREVRNAQVVYRVTKAFFSYLLLIIVTMQKSSRWIKDLQESLRKENKS